MNEIVYNKLFGARVRHYRERLGLTQKELSERLGYTSHASIAKIEAGKATIPLAKLPDFCTALNVPPYDLLGLKEEDKKVWTIAEDLEKNHKTESLDKFIELYLKLMDGK